MTTVNSFNKYIWSILAVLLFAWLQYQLWFDDTSIVSNYQLQNKIDNIVENNEVLDIRNQVLADEILQYKDGLEGLEAKARKELGMIKEGETFFIIVDKTNTHE